MIIDGLGCVDAPSNCAALFREDCSNTPATCGFCLPGYTSGSSGHSNDACRLEPNESEVDRRRLQDVSQKICSVPDCSGKGVCIYRHKQTWEFVMTCNTYEISCEAICVCEEEWYGSICQESASSIDEKRYTRELQLSSLLEVVNTEQQNQFSISDWMISLNVITSNEKELNSLALDTAKDTLDAIFLHIWGADKATIPIASIVNQIVESTSNFAGISLELLVINKTLDSYGMYNRTAYLHTISSLQPYLEQLAQLIAMESERGQAQLHATFPYISMGFVDEAPDESGSIHEVTSNASYSLFLTSDDDSLNEIKVARFTIDAGLFLVPSPLRLISNPLVLVYDLSVHSSISEIIVSKKFQHNRLSMFIDNDKFQTLTTEEPPVRTRCYYDEIIVHNHTCENDYLLEIECNGTDAVVTSYCAYAYEVVNCAMLQTDSETSIECETSDHSAESTFCVCLASLSSLHPIQGGSAFTSINVVPYAEVQYYPFPHTLRVLELPPVTPSAASQTMILMGSIFFVGFCFVLSTSGLTLHSDLVGYRSKKRKKGERTQRNPKVGIDQVSNVTALGHELIKNLRTFRATGLIECFANHHYLFSAIGIDENVSNYFCEIMQVVYVTSAILTALGGQAYMYRVLLGMSVDCDAVDFRSQTSCNAQLDGFR